MPLDPFETLERSGRGWFVPLVLVVAGAIGTTVAVSGVHNLTLIEADDPTPEVEIEPQADPDSEPENQADVMAMVGKPLTPEPTVS